MNATRIQRITAMINFALVTLIATAASKIYLKDRRYVDFQEALKIPGLTLAMCQQVTLSLPSRHQAFYLSSVISEEIQYVILGSYEQWKWFYSVKWDYLLSHCPCVIGVN